MTIRAVVVHLVRLGVVALLVWLVHAIHARRAGAARDVAVDGSALLEVVRRHLPAAAEFGGESAAVIAGREVLDASGGLVGTALRTSPTGDAAIGFSGATELLVVCDGDLIVRGVEILSSRDTRDHVRAVEVDPVFLASFRGQSLASLADPTVGGEADVVAGATLTSLAIREAIALRIGGNGASSRFAHVPDLNDFRRIYPEAASIEPDVTDDSLIRISDGSGNPLGFAIRTSPAADRVMGYQGPTDAVIGFDSEGRVRGIAVLESFDNEPYVGYVRDDRRFRGLWRGMTLEQIAAIDPRDHGVEGVSGATMTSQAIATGILRMLQERTTAARAARNAGVVGLLGAVEGPQWGAIAVIAAGIVTAFTRLRGGLFGRIVLPVVVIGYLGFGAGALLSQAQTWGWAKAGVPVGATVLVVLAAVAAVLPATTRRNVYCSHLCAHGAAQQLLQRIAARRSTSMLGIMRSAGRAGPSFAGALIALPWLLVAVAILATVLEWPLELVDLEPFDAWLPSVAGIWVITLAIGSLLVSARWPMAYCRHGCPTGALLDHLRLNRRSDRITWRDGILLGCLLVALFAWAAAR